MPLKILEHYNQNLSFANIKSIIEYMFMLIFIIILGLKFVIRLKLLFRPMPRFVLKKINLNTFL